MENYRLSYAGGFLLPTPKIPINGSPLLFSPCGTILMVKYESIRGVFEDQKNKICLWHVKTGKLLREFAIKDFLVYSQFSPEGDTLIMHEKLHKGDEYYSSLSLWDIHENRKLGKLRTHQEMADLVEITESGNLFVQMKIESSQHTSYTEVQLWSRPHAESAFALFKKLYPLFILGCLHDSSTLVTT